MDSSKDYLAEVISAQVPPRQSNVIDLRVKEIRGILTLGAAEIQRSDGTTLPVQIRGVSGLSTLASPYDETYMLIAIAGANVSVNDIQPGSHLIQHHSTPA